MGPTPSIIGARRTLQAVLEAELHIHRRLRFLNRLRASESLEVTQATVATSRSLRINRVYAEHAVAFAGPG